MASAVGGDRMLELDKVTRRFGERTAVAEATLAIPGGQMVGIIGRSGAGKTTLLRMINRLIDPSEGRLLFDSRDITGLRGRALHAWRASFASFGGWGSSRTFMPSCSSFSVQVSAASP